MKKLLTAALMLLAMQATFAQSSITRSKISFSIKNLGIKTGGTIGGIQADIAFDPANLSNSRIEASADVNTLNTDNTMRDEHLKKEDYFDVAKYPRISMSSVSFKHKSGNNYTGQFNISIKGKTKPVEVPFTYNDTGGSGLFNGSFKINRKDFGIGGNSLTLSNEVTVFLDIETKK